MEQRTVPSQSGSRGDGGLSLLVTVVSLLITALLVLVVLKATVTSGHTGSSTPTPVSTADATQAQQSLSGALATLQQIDPGGQGTVDAATLQAADPSLTFTPSPSAGPLTVSVAPSSDGSSVALADHSADGTCWFVWWSPTAGTWYGAQTSQTSCAAPGPAGPPSPGAVSDNAIGWQQGTFPAV